MRRTDEDRFRTPYSTDAAVPAEWARAIGISVPGVRQLGSEILGDFDPRILGVRWWAAHLPMAPRILIGDHLYLCVGSIETNLVEARIHLLEALGAAEEQERRFACAVTADAAGALQFKQPKVTSPADDLIRPRVNLHIVGCVRAIASALDCLGGVIFGVLALPAPLFKASYKSARTLVEQAQTGGHEIQHTYGRRFLDLIDSAGPKGWDEWVLEFRNMLVHRGRRTWSIQVVPAGTCLHIPGGGAVFPSRVVPMLPSDPGRSEIEVLRDISEKHLVLRENGWNTLNSAIESTCFIVERTAALLVEAWARRRADPAALPQPAAQWPGPKTTKAPFDGYAPESEPFDFTQIHTDPSFGTRITAAAVNDAARERWRDSE